MTSSKKFDKFILSVSLCLIGMAPAARAQSSEDALLQDLKNRATRIIDTTMKTLGDRTAEFNSHMADMNEARPLEVKNLDSANIAQNISRTLQFIQYLKDYRAVDDGISLALEDSLEALRQETPTGAEEKAFDAVGESYAADHKGWNKYIGTLSELYSGVLDALIFLQSAPHTIAKDKLEFKTAKEAATYNKLMKPIDAAVRESKKAFEESKKATEWANQKITELNGTSSTTPKKKKKK